jgi:hypothetical protein
MDDFFFGGFFNILLNLIIVFSIKFTFPEAILAYNMISTFIALEIHVTYA